MCSAFQPNNVLSLGRLSFEGTLVAASLPKDNEGDRRCDEDGAQRSEDDTQRHGECERLDALASKEEDAEQHDERRH